ncbi:MAG: hypothetical protein PWQ54_548 [Bacteroidales bacterium]|jgi:UDP:flavonoid glycosyltransferase YjiC (YdhE family)|nr:hypothetical protein [Bacteroidales bacterium]
MRFDLSAKAEKSSIFALKPFLSEQKTILFCPLNWGLGHASRSVPVIRVLQKLGFRVILAADKAPLAFLRAQFPALEWIRFKGFDPRYAKGKKQFFKLAFQLPIALWFNYQDRRFIAKLQRKTKIDLIISDNRFGASSKTIPSVIITHQLNLKIPESFKIFTPLANKLNHELLKHFSQCWIPDFKGQNRLSGELSNIPKNFIPTIHLGILSRFSSAKPELTKKDIDLLVILSGPEPQRSQLEAIIINQLADTTGNYVILRGLPQLQTREKTIHNTRLLNHAADELFIELINKAKQILCRSGYSSIMDLASLKRHAVLVPTPGQTEQEYLAKYLARKNLFSSVNQYDINIKDLLKNSQAPALAFPETNPEKQEAIIRHQLQSLGIL